MREPALALSTPVGDEVKTTTCYMCAGRCGIRVHLQGGAIRFIDGASRLTSRGFINTPLQAGPHLIKIVMPGYKPMIFEHTVARHDLSELFLELEPGPRQSSDAKPQHRPPPP